MQITHEWAREKGACDGGMQWFQEHFPDGGDYQEILDELAKENRSDWASWLIQNAGRLNTVLEIDGNLDVEHSIFFAGFIRVKGFLRAAKRIIAGSGIKAGWGIEAGSDWGIYAGLRVRISMKAEYALVVAKTEPRNIICGTFKTAQEKPETSEGDQAEAAV